MDIPYPGFHPFRSFSISNRPHSTAGDSRMTYTEMTLLNTAFCYTRIGEGALAIEYYGKTLVQFPDSEMAKSALRMMHSLTDDNQ